MRWIVVLAVLAIAGCGGHVEATGVPPLPRDYTREQVTYLPASGPTAVESVAVSCEIGETLLDGGCELGSGGTLVQNETTGLGWTCSARTDVQDVRLRVWAMCERP